MKTKLNDFTYTVTRYLKNPYYKYLYYVTLEPWNGNGYFIALHEQTFFNTDVELIHVKSQYKIDKQNETTN